MPETFSTKKARRREPATSNFEKKLFSPIRHFQRFLAGFWGKTEFPMVPTVGIVLYISVTHNHTIVGRNCVTPNYTNHFERSLALSFKVVLTLRFIFISFVAILPRSGSISHRATTGPSRREKRETTRTIIYLEIIETVRHSSPAAHCDVRASAAREIEKSNDFDRHVA